MKKQLTATFFSLPEATIKTTKRCKLYVAVACLVALAGVLAGTTLGTSTQGYFIESGTVLVGNRIPNADYGDVKKAYPYKVKDILETSKKSDDTNE